MDAPPVLTPERIDAMLSIMAEVCLEAVVESGQRQKTAEDPEAFERGGRTLQRACRNLRQTIAMKQRHDREQARKAEDGRKRAVAERVDAERVRRDAVAHKRAAVQRHLDRMLWDEYEQDEALELGEEVEDRLANLAQDADFLDTPLETLIQRLADDIGLGEEPKAPIPAGGAETSALSAKGQLPTKPLKTARPRDGGDPSRTSAGALEPPHGSPPARGRAKDGPQPCDPCPEPSPGAISAVESDGPTAEAAPPEPPPRPPDPPPEPYIPPWEKLRPGQHMPGGSGW